MKNFLNAQIGSQLRKVKVKDIKKEEIKSNEKDSEKIVFTVYDDTVKREFKISDCWIESEKTLKISGLWYLANDEGIIAPNSTLAKMLTFYKCSSLVDLLNSEVLTYPDPKGFLVLVGCKCTEQTLEKALSELKKK
jgi:hypothetical protein